MPEVLAVCPSAMNESIDPNAAPANAETQPSPPVKPRRPRWPWLVSAAIVLLAIAEAGLRIADQRRPLGVLRDGRYERHLATARPARYAEARAAGVERVVVIADATLAGALDTALTYPQVLERILTRGGHPAQVLDLSVPNVGPSDFPAILVREGLPADPDRVLVWVTMGEDLAEASVTKPSPSRSYLLRLLRSLRTIRRVPPTSPAPPTSPSDAERLGADELERRWIFESTSPRLTEAVARTVATLTEMKRLTDARQVRLTVLLAPDPAQVEPKRRNVLAAGAATTTDAWNLERPNELLTEALTEHGIEVRDLTAELARRGGRTTIYRPDAIGWNATGNRMVAGIVARDVFQIAQRRPRRARGPAPAPGPNLASGRVYEGVHEYTACDVIRAWAWKPNQPEETVDVDVFDGDALVVTQSADVYRRDLLAAGKGDGSHGFELRTPSRLRDGEPHTIRLRVSGSSFDLTNTPTTLWCPAP